MGTVSVLALDVIHDDPIFRIHKNGIIQNAFRQGP